MPAIGAYADPATLKVIDANIQAGSEAVDQYKEDQQAAQDKELKALKTQFESSVQQEGANLGQRQSMKQQWLDAMEQHQQSLTAADNSTQPSVDAPTPNQREDRPGAVQGPGGGGGRGAASLSPGGWQKDDGGLTPAQYSDSSLTAAEANAACGPAAAVAFARANGRNPTLREATDLAKRVGWTTGGGMNGIANEKALMDKLQIPNHLEGTADWNKIAADAQGGNPVVVSTTQHYFVVDGVSGSKFHVGNSGTAMTNAGGSAWMTRQQIETAGRGVNGVLYSDHPLATGPSLAEGNNDTSANA